MKLSTQIALAILFFALISIGARLAFFVSTPLAGISLTWIGVYFGCLLLGLIPIWIILQRRIIRRINVLTEAVKRVRLGDLTQTVPIDAHDELSELSQNFNEMTQQLVVTQRTLLDARKLAEERLAELQSSINSLHQGFIITDAAGTVLQANDAVREMLIVAHQHAASPEALPTIHQLAALFPADTHLPEAVMRSMQTRDLSKFTALPYGDGRFINIFISPVVDGGQALGSVLLIEDVTEERIMQRSRDEFFSIASHELRTPLTAIRGNMSIAREYFADAMKDKNLKELVEDTGSASVRLIEIVNDFLDSSRLEQGKMVFNFGSVKLTPLVTSIIHDLEPLRLQQDNTITTDALDSLPPAWADEGRLRQILYNLISNANKYSEHASITISGRVEDDRVRIRIADTGKGISAEYQKLLFRKFQQAGENTLTRDNTKGTGLGLYISKLLANNMHGDVVLEQSEAGQGSTFAIILPVSTPDLEQQAVSQKAAKGDTEDAHKAHR